MCLCGRSLRAQCWRQTVVVVLVALKWWPEDTERHTRAVDVAIELRHALVPLAENQLLVDRLEEAEALATALNDNQRLAQIASFKVSGLIALGEHRRAIMSAERALAGGAPNSIIQIEMHFRLGQVYWQLGDYARA